MPNQAPVHSQPMRLFFLSQNLELGGAERQLAALAGGLAQRGHTVYVASFYGGPLAETLATAGCHIVNLKKRGRWDIVPFLWRTARLLRQVRPDVIHSYLPVPNVLAALLRPLVPRARLVWGIRAADVDLSRYDFLMRLSYLLERCLAPAANLVVANSRKGAAYAIAHGFRPERLKVVPNGIDTEQFRPDTKIREEVRAALGVAAEVSVIGLVARFDPMKDHGNFLAAARILVRRRPSVHFVLAGKGVEPGNRAFADALTGVLAGRLLLLGGRSDIPQLMTALDIGCLASAYGEGFPNVLGEAMACGAPCVSTDVGDAAWIIGDTGLIVPPRDPEALATAMETMIKRLESEGETLRQAARERIMANFSLSVLVDHTERLLYNEVCKRKPC